MLVIDASAAHNAVLAVDGFAFYRRENLVAPPLLWSEVRSSLHERMWRGDLNADIAREAVARLERAPIGSRTHPRLGLEAWRLSDEFGWAKTYDAEYVALALLLGCRLVTLDAALRRVVRRLVPVIGPAEL
ncbi:MAG: type II toxin-antitoxin system VapC family toxin [Chloroflexi bacterium]|nr:MAG: type II toxin-antitoxin system VapC family toxin [Chloroflexota bacterium]